MAHGSPATLILDCRVVFDLDRDEACSKQIVDLTQTWYYATVVTKSICLGPVLVENVVETASCNLVKMLTPLQNNEFGQCFVRLGSQLDDFVANNSGSVLFGHDSDMLILLVAGDFCRLSRVDFEDEGPSSSLGGDDRPYLARQLSVF
jgi:hypothetical protein